MDARASGVVVSGAASMPWKLTWVRGRARIAS